MEISDLRPFVFGGIASIVAESGTFPIDCTKTRLQIQTTRIYKGMIDAGTQIYRKEGVKALYSGILPAILRQAVYGTIKFGSYYSLKEVIANLYPDRVEESLWVNVSCAAFAGSVSSAIANPTDVLKVRMQIHGKGTLGTGLFRCFYDLYLNEGFRGLYRGVGPTSQRAAIIAMVELPVYDYCKHYLLDSFGDHIYNHFISSFIASFGSAVASTPVDVIRTRLMNQKRIIGNQLIGPTAATTLAENQKVYFTSSFECASSIIRNEGLSALYKGFIPTFLRMGPWNIIFFCTYEQLKKL